MYNVHHTYIYIYIYIYVCMYTVHMHTVHQVHELPWGHWWIGNNREGTLSTCTYLYTYTYTHTNITL